MKRWSWAILACALVWAASPAAAQVQTKSGFPISGAVINPCNGETVVFAGTLHAVTKISLDNGGGFHGQYHDNIHVTASGDLGNSYVGTQQDNTPINGKVGVVQTLVMNFSEISRGSAPNFVVHSLLHVTVNPNGTTTSFVDHYATECRGAD